MLKRSSSAWSSELSRGRLVPVQPVAPKSEPEALGYSQSCEPAVNVAFSVCLPTAEKDPKEGVLRRLIEVEGLHTRGPGEGRSVRYGWKKAGSVRSSTAELSWELSNEFDGNLSGETDVLASFSRNAIRAFRRLPSMT